MHYTPLYIKTDASLLESLIKIDDLIAFALKSHLSSLAITDNTMYNVIEFYDKCKKNNIKPIIGFEVKIEEEILLLYAENNEGYQNLLKLATIKSERALTLKDIKIYHKNLLAIFPFESKNLLENLEPFFPHYFIGYKTKDQKNQIKEREIYLHKILYFEKNEKEYLSYLQAISKGTLEINVPKIEEDYSFEIDSALFSSNNYKIESFCNVEIKKEKNLLPIYDCPDHMDSYTYLKKLCVDSLKEKFGKQAPLSYIERLKYELSVIKNMNFCNYFLIVWDYVMYAKKSGILVGTGRGSAAGSLVSYLLHITDIDPIYYHLFFERFLNPERVTMPDIDIDFEDERRDEVVNYCISKYGKKKVAPIITFGTLKAKQAIRDVARCMDMNTKIVDIVCKFIDSSKSLKENYKENEKLRHFIQKDEELKKMYKVALKIENLKRHTSIHAAGIIMSSRNIDEVIPLEFHDSFYITGYSMEYLESLGLLKMDFLSLTTLSTIHDIINDINKHEKREISFDEIPLHDQKTMDLFQKADTACVFQFESAGMKQFLRKLKPNDFEEIIAAIALYRPGPMQNIDSFIARKSGKEKIDYFHKDLEEILKPTYGIIVYQEQIMQIASKFAGYTFGQADVLRRAMSKKKQSVLLKEKDRFIKGSIEKGYEKQLALKVYDLILKFANFGFNRSHSVAYSLIAYKLAYLKAHYRIYFMKNLLNACIRNEEKTKEYLYECRSNHLSIKAPDIHKSEGKYTILDGDLLLPFPVIKGVGPLASEKIIEERNKKPFQDIYDFMLRCYGGSVNKKVLESLIYAGAFHSFGYYKKTLIDSLDVLINYAEIAKDLSEEFTLKPELLEKGEYSKKESLEKELSVYGFYIGDHPITEYKNKYKNIIPLKDIPKYFDKYINTIVYIEKQKEVTTKKNEKMCFVTGADEIENVDVVFFPKIYEKIKMKVGDIALLKAKVEKRFDKYQLIVSDIKILNN